MHIAVNGWFWNQPWVGSGQYIRNLLSALTALDKTSRYTLVVPANSGSPKDVPANVEVVYGKTRFGGNLGKVWFEQQAFPHAVKRVKADIAHVPYWASPFNSKPARLVTSILDIIPLVLPEYRGGLRASFYTSLVTASARGSAHVLTLSEASKRDIVKHLQIPPEKISVTPLAVDHRFHPKLGREKDEAVREKYNLPSEFVLYLGGFDIRKNVHKLLLAWTYAGPSLGEQIPLVLAGHLPQEWSAPFIPDLPQYAKDLEIEPYLQWLGAVDEEDKPSIYRLAKVMVWPSRYEGFGLPPLEAMASGTPVVAANISSTPEIVGESAYLVEADDARALGAAILSVAIQDDLHGHLSNAGLGQASKFSWQKTAQQTLEVYQSVLKA